ncbi:hypothetical protein DUI87_29566 [Hirundo rustica rustica]|uniref:Integrase catalytic domain-containing protein n=1 Tax=Hirundo rustica rustica TaxID=333673 RepID=A0A3M0J5E7_HIRRU|nr:hypothetical protein DUI87_29566 [Hirundo rustica rustica]
MLSPHSDVESLSEQWLAEKGHDMIKLAWVHPYYILHVRSHKNLPGFVAEGVNPRGLRALEIWQTDVTQIAEFGWLKYVHVTVDTFSSAMWASAHTGEKTCYVIAHQRQAFALLGTPSAVKTDNGPAYVSQKVRQFLQLWGVSHKFGIPHSPTGQVIVERAHGTLKRVLQKQKWGMQGETLHSWLAKALYTINHLTVPQNSNNPVILNHHLSLQASDKMHQPRAKVQILGYAGYLRSVFVLTCDRKGKIWPIGKLETMTKMKVIKWMDHRLMTQMQTTQEKFLYLY